MNKKEKTIYYIKLFLAFLPSILSLLGIYLLFSHPYLGTKLNLIITGIIICLSLISIAFYFITRQKNMKKLAIICMVINLLFSFSIGYCDYIYIHLNESVGKITDTTEYVNTYIYTLSNSTLNNMKDIKGHTLGIQTESTTTSQNVIKGLEENNIKPENYQLKTYANFVEVAKALIDKQIDAIAIDERGLSMVSEVYPDFQQKTKKIAEFKTKSNDDSNSDKVNISKDPFVVLVNGVDTRTGDLNQGSHADVIMLAAFNPQTMKLSLVSIPRDTYIPVACQGNRRDKITHSGSGGINCTIESLEETFKIKINYYVKANFRSVVDLVDAIGGIDVNVPRSFCEQNSKDQMNTICIDQGFQHLNGEQALAMSRHRKTLPNGDIGRGLNQQIILTGMIDKLASGKILTSVDKLLNVLGNNIQTNFSKKDMYDLFALLTSLGSNSEYSNISALQINSSTIGGEGRMMYTDWAGTDIYYYVPYKEAIQAVTTEINRVLGKEDCPLPNAKFAFNANKKFIQNDPELSKINSGKTLDVTTTSSSNVENNTQTTQNQNSQNDTTEEQSPNLPPKKPSVDSHPNEESNLKPDQKPVEKPTENNNPNPNQGETDHTENKPEIKPNPDTDNKPNPDSETTPVLPNPEENQDVANPNP